MKQIIRFITNNPPYTNEELARPAKIAILSVWVLFILVRLYFYLSS